MLRPGLLSCAVMLICTTACAYPRRTTPLSGVTQAAIDRGTQPEDLWQLRLVRAEIPREKRGGLSWDDQGGLPDAFVVLSLAGKELWRGPVVADSTSPVFDAQPPLNLAFDREARLRIELWDKDAIGADPIGMYEGRALAEAILGTESTIKLDSGATLTLKVLQPEPKLGVGILEYEERPGALLVLSVSAASPAARAGIAPGDRIVAIDGKSIKSLSVPEAESALTLAAQHESVLKVERNKVTRTVKLDNGYVWPSL